jgi:hypothetical protein
VEANIINSTINEYAPTIIFGIGTFLAKTIYSYIKLKLEEVQKETQNKELARLIKAAELEEHVITKAISYAEEKKRGAKKQSKEKDSGAIPAPADMMEMALSYISSLQGPGANPFEGKEKQEIVKKIEATLFGKRKEGLK